MLQDEIEELEGGVEEAETEQIPMAPPVAKKTIQKRMPEREIPKEDDFFDEEDMIPKEMEDEIIKEKILARESEEDEFEESLRVRKTKAKPKKTATKPVERKKEEDDFDFEFIDLDDDK